MKLFTHQQQNAASAGEKFFFSISLPSFTAAGVAAFPAHAQHIETEGRGQIMSGKVAKKFFMIPNFFASFVACSLS